MRADPTERIDFGKVAKDLEHASLTAKRGSYPSVIKTTIAALTVAEAQAQHLQRIEKAAKVLRLEHLIRDANEHNDMITLLQRFELLAAEQLKGQAQAQEIDRLKKQAQDISLHLSDAGIGPCPIPEGVRSVIARTERISCPTCGAQPGEQRNPQLCSNGWHKIPIERLTLRLDESHEVLVTLKECADAANTRAEAAEARLRAQFCEAHQVDGEHVDVCPCCEVVGLAERLRVVEGENADLRKDCAYHAECRPNRQQAEAAIADAKRVNDAMADVIRDKREAEAHLTVIRALVQTWREKAKGSIEHGIDHSLSRKDSDHREYFGGVNAGLTYQKCADELESRLPLAPPREGTE